MRIRPHDRLAMVAIEEMMFQNITVEETGPDLGECFRADAKAEGDRVVIGGWDCWGGKRLRDAKWFSMVLTRSNAPWACQLGRV